MVQETSLEAYESIVYELGQRQRQVLRAITELREATNKQIARHVSLPINSVTPRVLELRKKKLVGVSRIGYDGPRKAIYWKTV